MCFARPEHKQQQQECGCICYTFHHSCGHCSPVPSKNDFLTPAEALLTFAEKELTARAAAATHSSTAVVRGLGSCSLPTTPPRASSKCRLSPTRQAMSEMHCSTALRRLACAMSWAVALGRTGDRSCNSSTSLLISECGARVRHQLQAMRDLTAHEQHKWSISGSKT